jgi:isoleucyl-tRNA synthetase
MGVVRTLARLGRAAREEAGVKVRQPLSKMVCVGLDEAALDPFIPLLMTELNVKHVEVATSADALVTLEARPNFRALGKKFGKATPLAAEAVRAFTSDQLRAFLRGEPLVVSVEGDSHTLGADDLTIIRRAAGALVVQEDGGFFAAIDPSVTPELKREGYARELISRVQRMRKESGFAVSDRIALTVSGGSEVKAVLDVHGAWIAEEVLATTLVFNERGEENDQMHAIDLDGITAFVAITRIQ